MPQSRTLASAFILCVLCGCGDNIRGQDQRASRGAIAPGSVAADFDSCKKFPSRC